MLGPRKLLQFSGFGAGLTKIVRNSPPDRYPGPSLGLVTDNIAKRFALLPPMPQAWYGDYHGTDGVGMMLDGESALFENNLGKIARAKEKRNETRPSNCRCSDHRDNVR